MIDDLELGYTPKNLKFIRQNLGKTQKEIADALKVSLITVQRWEMAVNINSHVDMPYKKWLEFIEYFK
ncbi:MULTISPECIES: helix-turn-helix domain-containing protein [Neisseria]|uniref:helix-turn-helix domain-containing protein n=1 Tax=Neisseria TaxID=482 RepID=UPI000E05C8A3|nr:MULTISPECIES: helix-turn-helix transcriptional regulator [Neisseria]SUA15967.1 putative phage associated protein [Neisseria lactamica]